ncbi:MAG: T9SS type A sorting domain-containing protein [Bacteroidia bacterium]
MLKNWLLLLCCVLLAAGSALGQSCTANGGEDLTVCFSDGSFILEGEPAQGPLANNPNYTWTGPPGFVISNPNILQPTVTPTGANFVPGFYTFTLCVDCSVGTSCNPIQVEIGSQPQEPAALAVSYNACNQVTVTPSFIGAANPGDDGVWTWVPNNNNMHLTSGGGMGAATFTQDNWTCGPYTVSFTVVNGGCEANTITTSVDIENLPSNITAGNDRTICITNTTTQSLCGTWLGCTNATGAWTQVGGPPLGAGTVSGQCGSFTFPATNATYTFQYTVTTAMGSACTGGSDQMNVTVVNASGNSLGPDTSFYYCGPFPASELLCAINNPNVGNWTWQVGGGNGGATIATGSGNCRTLNFNGSTSNYFWVRAIDPGVNGQCGDTKFFRFYRLDDVDVTADTVGIGCVPPGNVTVNLGTYLTGENGASNGVTVNSVPGNSNIPVNQQTGLNVTLDVEGCYTYTVVSTVTDPNNPNLSCSDTTVITICRYEDVEKPNAGEPQSVCGTTADLNGSNPDQTGTTILWTALPTNPNATTISPSNATDPTVSGLNDAVNGLVYGYVYTFTLDNPAGQPCSQSDTTYITIDCPVECDSLYLASCCEVIIETGDSSNLGNSTVRANALSYLGKATKSGSDDDKSRSGNPFPDDCDPCIDGGYPVWVEDETGTPIDQNDSDPCITIEWLDDQGVVIYTGWAFWATVDEDYTVRVTDVCQNCTWERDFTYTCCPDIPVVIQNCCDIGGLALPTKTAKYIDGIYDDINKDNGTSFARAASCDPCLHPEIPFVIMVGDGNHNPIDLSLYTVTWSASNGASSTTNWILAYVNVTYYVEVVDANGCIYRDTFLVDCCATPANPRCTVDRRGRVVLSWDPVPGVTDYQIAITTNDPDCCRPTGFGQSILVDVRGGTSYTLPLSYRCASWRVRSNCGPTDASDWSRKQCICGNRLEAPNDVFVLDGGKRVGEDVENTISAYPSPASNFLNVEGPALETGTVLQLVDVAGKVVLAQQVEEAGKATIRTSDIPNGVYFLQVTNRDVKISSQKVVILH